MSSKWVKVVDPNTGKTRFTNQPLPDEVLYQKPANAVDKDPNKLYCVECDKVIDGRMIRALEKNWHADCFACCKCSRQFEMNTLAYTVDDGSAYCRQCMNAVEETRGEVVGGREYFDATSNLIGDPTYVETRVVLGEGPKYGGSGEKPLADLMTKNDVGDQPTKEVCVACGNGIQGMSIGTNHGVFHEQCFKCSFCSQLIAAESSFKMNGALPMHGDCFKKSQAPPCGRCEQPAFGKTYNVKGTRYHIQCYICTVCEKSLEAGHLAHESKLFCSSACKKKHLANPQQPQASAAPSQPPPSSAPPPKNGNKFCGECGHPNPSRFCGNCGAMQQQ